jgi:acetyl esterase/lipase
MIFGLKHLGRVYAPAVRDYVATSGLPMLMVDYRIAPEHSHPTPVEDCYLHPGCPHAFEALARGADVSRRAIGDRIRRLRAF